MLTYCDAIFLLNPTLLLAKTQHQHDNQINESVGHRMYFLCQLQECCNPLEILMSQEDP